MIEVTDHFPADVTCPWCGARILVEDSQDFGPGPMEREAELRMDCPACERGMFVPTFWIPTYGKARREPR